MTFGDTLGTACLTFAITNIDDIFVLVTFFTEASTSHSLTPLKIVLGQYIGFTIIVAISLIGFAVALVLPSEPIGFLGLLPILLGVWKGLEVLLPIPEEDEVEELRRNTKTVKAIAKVASITLMNGGDNIGTYIPLFSQAKRAEIAVYVVTYYILLGVWCLAARLVLRQKHILRIFKKYARWVIPLLYLGLGVYIVVKSECYPWSIEKINNSVVSNPGVGSLAGATAGLLLTWIGCMVWLRLKERRKRRIQAAEDEAESEAGEGEGEAAAGDAPLPAHELHTKESNTSEPEPHTTGPCKVIAKEEVKDEKPTHSPRVETTAPALQPVD